VLRQGDEAEPRSPASGLAQLDSLVAGAAATGLEVRTRVEGAPRPLSAGTDLAAFRIVQESLTNVTRHAGPAASATVRIGYGADELVVEVTDNGNGVGSASGRQAADSDRQDRRSVRPGRGLVGMRERVAALGGELTAGPRPGGGFRVLARLPLTDEGSTG
jgi:signal transduction histidine kinase